jgi:hypothetical protein
VTKLQFCLQLPDGGNERFTPLILALESLTQINEWHLATNPNLPSLYDAGVRYKEEPPGREDWCDAPTVIKQGWGDCEDLAAYRCAELRAMGVDAECVIRSRYIDPSSCRKAGYPAKLIPRDGIYLVHVMVRWPDGHIECPSKILGMRGAYTNSV